MAARETVVSADDVVLLSALVEHAGRPTESEPPADRIAPLAAAGLNTRVEFEDLGSGQRELVSLVHPTAADVRAGRISVLSPVGRALLGKRPGQDVAVTLPSGDSRELMVLAVRAEDGQ